MYATVTEPTGDIFGYVRDMRDGGPLADPNYGAGVSDVVTVAWSPECALRTSWEIFTDYWSDFCYPSSDHVAVLPESDRWALFYDHEEQFEFVPRPSA